MAMTRIAVVTSASVRARGRNATASMPSSQSTETMAGGTDSSDSHRSPEPDEARA